MKNQAEINGFKVFWGVFGWGAIAAVVGAVSYVYIGWLLPETAAELGSKPLIDVVGGLLISTVPLGSIGALAGVMYGFLPAVVDGVVLSFLIPRTALKPSVNQLQSIVLRAVSALIAAAGVFIELPTASIGKGIVFMDPVFAAGIAGIGGYWIAYRVLIRQPKAIAQVPPHDTPVLIRYRIKQLRQLWPRFIRAILIVVVISVGEIGLLWLFRHL